ncbi:MAG: beta-propeller fold lactonase family protein [Candidatus Marinimicrobia bacterium]|jgi:DNA-binding beta-propeller fold protein YncE|nr:beta-propeller fold lactonase family protein [Candidatus Neomarinimicrobiota bacterium]MBT6869916.1 beta-propeller fold lactonase family protein [Candidatus Neomarinimicrobiota bacterium]
MNFSYKIFIYISTMFILSCGSDEIVQYFEYPDHNVLNIGSQLTDLVVTSDSDILIAADKGNNQVRFIDVSTDEMSILANVWVGSEPTSLELTADGQYLLVGLQGASSVAVVSVLEMELLGSMQLGDDGVYDIEYINAIDQLIVSFVASNPTYNKTKLYDITYYDNFFNCWCSGLDANDCVCKIGGCMDENACNYNPDAINGDDRSCAVEDCLGVCGGSAVVDGCDVCNGTAVEDDCGVCYGDGSSCEEAIPGCMNESACNYDPDATFDNGSCEVFDCAGECNGTAEEDCAGECNGEAIEIYDGQCIISLHVATPSIIQIGAAEFEIEDDYAGFISLSDDEGFVYIIDRFGGIDRVYKYDVSGNWNFPDSYSAVVGTISSFHDIEYVPDYGVVVAVGGVDSLGEEDLDHSPAFGLNDLSHIANFGVGSTPLALAYDPIGEHIYISPTDVDDNGMFVIEYSIQTQLQTNYYQVAGRLGSHALVVDPKGEYVYAAVDDLSDQDTDEPYNNSSFNIQRIQILPEGTYDSINNFE